VNHFLLELKDRLTLPAIILVTLFIVGTLGYKVIGWNDWGLLDCAFMTAITLTAVGYGDVLGVDSSTLATIYTIVLTFIGLGLVLYCISTITAFIVEGGISILLKERKMLKRIAKLENHYIVAGAGSTGQHVLKEMYQMGVDMVVIESDPEKIQEMEEMCKGIHHIQGDATDDHNLINAGVEKAKGLVACLSNDKDNLYITVSAKNINPGIIVVARAVAMAMKDKLKRVGANYVVSPNQIGGLRMASEVLRPHVVTFLDKMLRATEPSTRIAEVAVEEGSQLEGRELRESRIMEETGLLVIAVNPDGSSEYVYNPGAHYRLAKGSVVIVIGDVGAIKKLKKMARA